MPAQPVQPERALALWGAGVGLAMAVSLTGLRLFNMSPPEREAQALSSLPFLLILATPHAVALAGLATRSDAVRIALLLAACLLSFVSLGVSLAGIGIVFLPSVVLYGVAAVRVLRRAGLQRGLVPLFGLAALVGALLTPYAFLRLFSGEDVERCWSYARYDDGRVEWRERQNEFGDSSGRTGMSFANEPGVTSQGGACVSDVVTASEAAASLTVWSLSAGALALVWAAGKLVPARQAAV